MEAIRKLALTVIEADIRRLSAFSRSTIKEAADLNLFKGHKMLIEKGHDKTAIRYVALHWGMSAEAGSNNSSIALEIWDQKVQATSEQIEIFEAFARGLLQEIAAAEASHEVY